MSHNSETTHADERGSSLESSVQQRILPSSYSVSDRVTTVHEQAVDHLAVLEFLRRLGVRPAGVVAGDPDWLDLPDEVNAKIDAVLTAGARWALERELDEIVARRQAEKDAALEMSQAADWAATARRIRDRDQWLRNNPWAIRRTA